MVGSDRHRIIAEAGKRHGTDRRRSPSAELVANPKRAPGQISDSIQRAALFGRSFFRAFPKRIKVLCFGLAIRLVSQTRRTRKILCRDFAGMP
jgi:hypothetical protein